jgi:hypothetical protein
LRIAASKAAMRSTLKRKIIRHIMDALKEFPDVCEGKLMAGVD